MDKIFQATFFQTARTSNLMACAICGLLAGVTTAFPQAAPGTPPVPATQAAPNPPPPPTPVPFDDALLRAANDLFSKAAVPAGNEKI
jgi:hypothetical protein